MARQKRVLHVSFQHSVDVAHAQRDLQRQLGVEEGDVGGETPEVEEVYTSRALSELFNSARPDQPLPDDEKFAS